jgi:hypothetical protein
MGMAQSPATVETELREGTPPNLEPNQTPRGCDRRTRADQDAEGGRSSAPRHLRTKPRAFAVRTQDARMGTRSSAAASSKRS